MFDEKKKKAAHFKILNAGKIKLENLIEIARQHTACKLDHVTDEMNIGFASGDSELVTGITEENSSAAGRYLHLNIRISQKKPAANIVKPLLRKKINEYMIVNNTDHVKAKIRQELKEEVIKFLLPSTLPSLKSIYCIIDTESADVFAGCSSRQEINIFTLALFNAFDWELELQNIDSFFVNNTCCAENRQCRFMTDLFLMGRPDTAVNPPFFFFDPEKEDEVTKLRAEGELARNGLEVQSALQRHKLLSRINLTVTGENIAGMNPEDRFSFTLHDNGTLTGLTLPESGETGRKARFAADTEAMKAVFSWIEERYAELAKGGK